MPGPGLSAIRFTLAFRLVAAGPLEMADSEPPVQRVDLFRDSPET
jgi:hypothetical protein